MYLYINFKLENSNYQRGSNSGNFRPPTYHPQQHPQPQPPSHGQYNRTRSIEYEADFSANEPTRHVYRREESDSNHRSSIRYHPRDSRDHYRDPQDHHNRESRTRSRSPDRRTSSHRH